MLTPRCSVTRSVVRFSTPSSSNSSAVALRLSPPSALDRCCSGYWVAAGVRRGTRSHILFAQVSYSFILVIRPCVGIRFYCSQRLRYPRVQTEYPIPQPKFQEKPILSLTSWAYRARVFNSQKKPWLLGFIGGIRNRVLGGCPKERSARGHVMNGCKCPRNRARGGTSYEAQRFYVD